MTAVNWSNFLAALFLCGFVLPVLVFLAIVAIGIVGDVLGAVVMHFVGR